VRLADCGSEIDGVGVGGGIGGVRGDRESSHEREKKQAKDFDAAFYCCSPRLWPSPFTEHLCWMRDDRARRGQQNIGRTPP
jgi:hypothetical protein